MKEIRNSQRNSKLLLLISTLTFVMVLILGSSLAYWLYYPYKVAEIKSPARVITKVVKAGNILEYELDAVVYEEYPIVEIRRIASNGIDYIMTTTRPPVPTPGVIRQTVSSNIIPETLPPSTYVLRFEAIHKVNPLRTVSVRWETEEFEVE